MRMRRLARTGPPEVSYSPQFLAILAVRLHRNAMLTVTAYAVCGCVLGAAALPLATRYLVPGGSALFAVCGAMIMGVIGVLVGREAAVFLRIQAQVALCELSIAERARQ